MAVKAARPDFTDMLSHLRAGDTFKEICKLFNITKSTFCRYLNNEAESSTEVIS